MESFQIKFGNLHSVTTYIGADLQNQYGLLFDGTDFKKFFFLVDSEVYRLNKGKCDQIVKSCNNSTTISLPDGETCKTFQVLENIYEELYSKGMDRSSVIIAIGGGATLNLAGLLAALSFRGLPVIYVPTSFMAMHDVISSLKTAVNSQSGKNNIGTFHPSLFNICDLSFLDTLPRLEWQSGLGEMVKNALILGADHFTLIDKSLDQDYRGFDRAKLVRTGILAKQVLLSEDPKEKSSGMIYEYGHTIGHAIERSFGSSVVPHGIAICWGMLFCSFAANRMGILDDSSLAKHDALIRKLIGHSLPSPAPSFENVMAWALQDSKRGKINEGPNEIACVLLEGIGQPYQTRTMLSPVSVDLAEEWYSTFAEIRKTSSNA